MIPLKLVIGIVGMAPVLLGTVASASDKPVYPDTIDPAAQQQAPKTPVVEEIYVGQPVNACDAVHCGHGQCVMKQGYPVCACEEGYLPDQATGLHCLTPNQTALNPSVGYGDPRAWERETRRQKQAARREMVKEARLALRDHPDYPGLRKKRHLGVAGIIVGGIAMGIGGMMALTMAGEDREIGMAGGIVAGLGFVAFLPGVIAASSARHRINDIYKLELERREHQFGLALAGVSPVVTPDGKGAGVGATFRF